MQALDAAIEGEKKNMEKARHEAIAANRLRKQVEELKRQKDRIVDDISEQKILIASLESR